MTVPAPARIAEWFVEFRVLRPVIEAVLEGRQGRVVTVVDPAEARSARLDLGCYAIFGGKASAPETEQLVATVRAPMELLVPDRQKWRDVIYRVHGRALEDRPMRSFSPHRLDAKHLAALASSAPDGVAIAPLDIPFARQLDDELIPHGLQTFESPEALVERGVGFVAVRDGSVLSAATSYARSARRLEIAISTRPEARRQGLARAAAAQLVRECLRFGLIPAWSASHPASKRLALELGFTPGRLCDIFYLTAG